MDERRNPALDPNAWSEEIYLDNLDNTENTEEEQESQEENLEAQKESAPQPDEEEEEPQKRKRPGQTARLRRQLDLLESKLSERDQVIDSLRSRLDNFETNTNRQAVDAELSRIDNELATAQQEFQEASNAADSAAMASALRRISELSTAKGIAAMTIYQQEQAQPPRTQGRRQEQEEEFDPQALLRKIPAPAKRWIAKNPWFYLNEDMRNEARRVEGELMREGYDFNDDDFYVELDNRLQNTIQSNSAPRRKPPVSIPNTGGKRRPQGDVEITQEDIRIMRAYGLTTKEQQDEYKRHKRAAQQGRVEIDL